MQITLGASKPEGLDPYESDMWDSLASEVAEIKKKGYVVEIPFD